MARLLWQNSSHDSASGTLRCLTSTYTAIKRPVGVFQVGKGFALYHEGIISLSYRLDRDDFSLYVLETMRSLFRQSGGRRVRAGGLVCQILQVSQGAYADMMDAARN